MRLSLGTRKQLHRPLYGRFHKKRLHSRLVESSDLNGPSAVVYARPLFSFGNDSIVKTFTVATGADDITSFVSVA